jgi:hypothetical protein
MEIHHQNSENSNGMAFVAQEQKGRKKRKQERKSV